MSFPPPQEELALHKRILASDPVAPVDLFKDFTDPLITTVQHDLRCEDDVARDSAIDALFEYLSGPSSYEPTRGRLCTLLVTIAKKRAIDRLRSRSSELRREQDFGRLVELWAAAPNGTLENTLDAEKLCLYIEREVPDGRDRAALALILEGERSTEALAEALGIGDLSKLERQREVKRNRDRLVKVLERLGARLRNEGGA